MTQIEKALARARSQKASPPVRSPVTDETLTNRDEGRRPPAAVTPSELLTQATSIALDPKHLAKHRITALQAADPSSAAYKMLRTRVLQRMRSHGWKKLAITSARTGAGKTISSINAAISLAQEANQQVILVDLDLRKPKIGGYLGLRSQFGISDFLLRGVPLERVILATNIPRLFVVPNYERVENSSEMLASALMRQLVETLTTTADSTIVLFDLPPLLDADDMLAFSTNVDAVLFIIAQGETRRGDVAQSMELIKDMNLLGTVLNKSNDQAPAYY